MHFFPIDVGVVGREAVGRIHPIIQSQLLRANGLVQLTHVVLPKVTSLRWGFPRKRNPDWDKFRNDYDRLGIVPNARSAAPPATR